LQSNELIPRRRCRYRRKFTIALENPSKRFHLSNTVRTATPGLIPIAVELLITQRSIIRPDHVGLALLRGDLILLDPGFGFVARLRVPVKENRDPEPRL
jgi:hypothetical protein